MVKGRAHPAAYRTSIGTEQAELVANTIKDGIGGTEKVGNARGLASRA